MTPDQIETAFYVVICLVTLIVILVWYAFREDKDNDL